MSTYCTIIFIGAIVNSHFISLLPAFFRFIFSSFCVFFRLVLVLFAFYSATLWLLHRNQPRSYNYDYLFCYSIRFRAGIARVSQKPNGFRRRVELCLVRCASVIRRFSEFMLESPSTNQDEHIARTEKLWNKRQQQRNVSNSL